MGSSLFDTGIRPAIDAHLLTEAAEVRDYGEFWSASSAGYCMRKNIFKRLGVPHVEHEDDARKQRVFTAGHIFHEWAQGITKEAGLSIASEVELQDEELMVRGHFDDLVLVDGNLILYDYKTRNSRNFNFAKEPSYFHRLQLGTYMYMIRRGKLFKNAESRNIMISHDGTLIPAQVATLTEGRTLNIEKDTLRMAEVQYMWDDQLEKDVVDYWSEISKHWNDKKIPPCTCADQAGGFMAKEKWNPYFYEGEPCSLLWYEEWKAGNATA